MQKLLNLAAVCGILLYCSPCRADAPAGMDASITGLRDGWAHVKYELSDPKAQESAIVPLEAQAQQAVDAYPARPEPKIWAAIILATDAGIKKSITGLPKVKRAKTLLEAALQEDAKALDGSAYTTLGSLYYQVPGWPISFGSNDKAEKNLKEALAVNPDGIDPNYFYGDFLLKKGDYNQALGVLRHALSAPSRQGYEKIDAGRKEEINQAIATAAQKAGANN